MTAKLVYWVSMARWMNLTIAEHRALELYCRDMNMDLGIDVIGDRITQHEEFQKDHDESKETSGGPGA